MSVLNNIRKHGIFLILIIALALFAFILSSVIENGGFSSGKEERTIGVINGEDISRVEFSNRLQNAQQNARRDLTTIQAVNMVWQNLVNQTLIQQQVEKLGLEVGDQQINNVLAVQFSRNPNFLTNGQFDINKLRSYVQQLKAVAPMQYQQWVANEQQFVEQAKTNVYFNLIAAGIGATEADAEMAYKLKNTSFDLNYVKVPYSAVNGDQIQVTDSDIQNYINQHKEQYTSKGSRDIRYVLFEEKASPEDLEAIKQDLVKLLNDHKTLNKAANVKQTVKGFKNTTDYAEYLMEHSDIPFKDYYVLKSELPETYADTLSHLNEGAVFGPYRENGFWKYAKLIDSKQMPDSVKIKHILITYQGATGGQNSVRSEEEAQQLADSILKLVQNNPDQFAELAQQYSDDPNSGMDGGELGWLAHPLQPNPLSKFAFNHKAGEMGIAQTDFGFHVISIEDIKNEQKALKLAVLGKQIEPSSETLNNLFNETTKFQMAVQGEGDFAKVAAEKGYEVRTVKGLQPLDEFITGIGAHRKIVEWAFQQNTQPGSIKRFGIGRGYIVVQLTAKTTKGLASVAEAKDEVKPILLKKKKTQYLKENLNAGDLNSIASKYNTSVESKSAISFDDALSEGLQPKVVAYAFGLKEGELSQPIQGEDGIYILKVNSVYKPGALDSYNQSILEETQQNMQMAGQQIVETLKNKAEIVDRRANFY